MTNVQFKWLIFIRFENAVLSLHYQPKYNLKSGLASGLKALLRWHDNVSVAINLSILVTAEGVENRDQLEMLTQFGIEEIQGFILSMPLDAQTVVELLNQNQSIDSILNS